MTNLIIFLCLLILVLISNFFLLRGTFFEFSFKNRSYFSLFLGREIYLLIIPGVFMFVFGGISGMIYTLGVILIGEQFKGAMLATATTAFTACWGIGSVIGPLVAGAGMDLFGVENMALIVFVLFLPYLPFPVKAWIKSRENSY
ncbi:MAG: hypothetical protein ABGY96_14715 [bacterium]